MGDGTDLLDVVAHRTAPLPRAPWVMYQEWHDLLFMHWPVPAAEMRGRVPDQLPLDTYDGQAWLAVTPFRVAALRPRALPRVPGFSHFPELNVRTYVRVNGKPGVYFFSLDAGSALAVAAARATYGLPYLRARMQIEPRGSGVQYRCVRTDRRGAAAEYRATYGPAADVEPAAPGTLTHWLTERYCLFVVRRGRVYEAAIHHVPWPLQPAVAGIEVNTMAASHGFRVPPEPPLLHFSRSLRVLVWAPVPADR